MLPVHIGQPGLERLAVGRAAPRGLGREVEVALPDRLAVGVRPDSKNLQSCRIGTPASCLNCLKNWPRRPTCDRSHTSPPPHGRCGRRPRRRQQLHRHVLVLDAAGHRLPALPRGQRLARRVSGLPVHPGSSAYIDSIGRLAGLKADFGSGEWDGGPIGIPYTVVGAGQPEVPVDFDCDDESDAGPYPIPRHARIEGGPDSDGDRHVLIVDRDACRLYETVRRLPERRRLVVRRLRCGLRPEVEPPAAGRLDLGRRRRTADPRRPRPLRRGRGRGDRPRHPGHRARVAARPTSGRPGTRPARAPTPTCRRWVCACGSRPSATSRGFDRAPA